MFAFFISSGLFLGWSLGANDASNVFGTAVGARMIRFKTAAIYCSIFIILGSVISGAGASHTLGKLGAVNAVAGAFIVAFAAAISVYLMTKARYPVSTSQAIVGAIIGWNLFSGSLTDYNSLAKIVGTWVVCPVISAIIAVGLYRLVVFSIRILKPHMFSLDALTRLGLLLVGAFGSYSLGANNIANVMGVFVPVSPFSDISLFGLVNFSSAQQLFLIGGISIAVGVFTYSKRVMETVGEGIVSLSPVAAFAVVSAHSFVLFLFASQGLESFLSNHGLPTIPLVPVSSSQAIVGAVIGVGLLKGGSSIRWRLLGGISSSWVVTPIIAAAISFVSLFFLQNVFEQKTYRPITYQITNEAFERIHNAGIAAEKIRKLLYVKYPDASQFNDALSKIKGLDREARNFIFTSAEINQIDVVHRGLAKIPVGNGWITEKQKNDLKKLEGRTFYHIWLLQNALAEISPYWQYTANDEKHNEEVRRKLSRIYEIFRYDSYGKP
jgi:PiT family inorganic phosphate transporter